MISLMLITILQYLALNKVSKYLKHELKHLRNKILFIETRENNKDLFFVRVFLLYHKSLF